MTDQGKSGAPPSCVVENLDGTRSEFFEIECTEDRLLALTRELFETHWDKIVFGPCVQGAVFEGRFFAKPRFSYRDGYATVEVQGNEGWHFHLCLGLHQGTRNRPTPPELAAWRRCSRAAFFRDSDVAGRFGSWGFRLWNGRGEQMMTVFFPNPWMNDARSKFIAKPRWANLALWMAMRARYAGVPPEPPPADPERPRMH